jgi:hypothetical protein
VGSLFSSGIIVEGILALMLVEGIVLLLLRASRRRGLTPLEVLSTLSAGAALMLALRAALIGSGWPMIAAWLLAALIAHGGDLALRWRLRRD